MRAYLALLLALPMTALAQTTTTADAGKVVISEKKDKDSIINQDECTNTSDDGLIYNWTLAKDGAALSLSSGTIDVTLSISTSSACPNPSGTVWSRTITGFSSGSSQYPSSGYDDLVSWKGAPLNLACSGTATQSIYVCAQAKVDGTDYSAVGSITWDQTVPPAPVATALDPGEGSLTIYYTAGTKTGTATADSATYYAVATPSDTTGTPKTTSEFTGGNIRIDGLQNGVSYNVQVFAKSSVGNSSLGSNVMTKSPVPVDDFWKLYESQGGREQGGCASGPAGVFALLVPVFFALRRRRA